MKRFLLRCLLLSSPVLIALVLYFILDPFKVIYTYESLIDTSTRGGVGLNKDYISTTTFDKFYKTEGYNAFIFGNSRSIFYEIKDWKPYLSSDAKPYHFDASGETLYGIERKLNYIDSKGLQIKHVLIVLDQPTLGLTKSINKHLNIISPQLDNSSRLSFHFVFFKAFLSPRFLVAYFDFKISGEIKPYMTEKFLLNNDQPDYNQLTNEFRYPDLEQLINEGDYYTKERLTVFFERPEQEEISPITIKNQQKQLLEGIKSILSNHKTDYKIIISPLYNQIKLNPSDTQYLKQLFGANTVFDFSGKNDITSDYKNYYEVSHYRPYAGGIIMKSIH